MGITLKLVFQAWKVMQFWFESWEVMENENYCIKTWVTHFKSEIKTETWLICEQILVARFLRDYVFE